MGRRVFLQVTAPAVLIGLLMLSACLASVRSINILQANLADILGEEVAGLQAAQELVIQLRQLRFHTVMAALDPGPSRQELVEEDHRGFEEALAAARSASPDSDELALINAVEAGYARYRSELGRPDRRPGSSQTDDLLRWADAHPVRHLVAPCQELLRVHREQMEQTARESEAVSRQARATMILLGLAGPLGGLITAYGIARGLIERLRRQQQEMLRAEQLAAVGQLAASVAHEVRNPLTSIKLLVGVALRTGQGSALTGDDLRVIHAEIGRLEQSVQGLLNIARMPQADCCPGGETPPDPRRRCDVRQIVHDALDLIRARAAQQGVEVEARLPAEAVPAAVDRGQLGTVTVNLLLNALDAMPTGGRLQVELGSTPDGDVRLAVEDTGPGISPAVADRLFTPFTTTKPTGTGLGLSICRTVAERHGGTITARNREEGGACFLLTVPNHKEAERADPAGR
jgi:signal transduction histidine kinase